MKSRMLRILAATFTLAFAPLLLTAGEGRIRRNAHAVTGEYIVVLNDGVVRADVPAVARRLAGQYGGSLQKVWQDALNGFFIKMTEGEAQGLSHDKDVKFIEENAAFAVSSSVPTKVDPACTPPSTCPTPDNRLWHLDVLDQNDAIPTHQANACADGSGATVYVIDTGVTRAHREFGNSPSRVADGYNASGDGSLYPAYDTCHGVPTPDEYQENTAIFLNGHGTGVGSIVAGSNVGVAPGAKIVPVKVIRCGEFAAKIRDDNHNTSTPMVVGQFAEHLGQNFYVCTTAGTTAPPNTPITWTTGTGATVQDGTVVWQWISADGYNHSETEQMLIDGVNWIVGPNNPNPRSPAVATLSTYQIAGSSLSGFETAINTLITDGITVIASANNQDANACDTTPGRLSRNNPNAAFRGKVITAGGTMIRNNPDLNPNSTATGGSFVNLLDPPYDRTKPTLLARWRCWAGDSDFCSANIYSQPPPVTPDPSSTSYVGWNLGSNGGACVTLFAPARNIPVASNAGDASGNPTLYRDVTVSSGTASGTSWSAPFVAGVVARLLQGNPSLTPDGVYAELMGHTTADLDPTELDPPNVTGTPNALLHLPDVAIAPLPSTFTGSVTASASGSGSLSYQWYQVNSDFNVGLYGGGAAASTPVAGQTSATLTVSPGGTASYFVRVTSSCGSADSNITTTSACQPASITSPAVATPSSIVAGNSATLSIGAAGTSPVVQWYTSNGVSVATGASINVSPATTTSYYATVANSCTSPITSNTVTVSVCQPPSITTQPTATPHAISPGGSSTLSIGVSGPSPTIQWFTSTNVFVGSGASISVSPASDTTYHATVSNGCGPTLTSNNVTVVICTAPTVTDPPTANRLTITAGQSSTLQASGGTGTTPLTYEWYTSAGTLLGTGKKFVVSPTVTTTYYYKISNACGRSAASATITITVQ